jgi:hypothetical protein
MQSPFFDSSNKFLHLECLKNIETNPSSIVNKGNNENEEGNKYDAYNLSISKNFELNLCTF